MRSRAERLVESLKSVCFLAAYFFVVGVPFLIVVLFLADDLPTNALGLAILLVSQGGLAAVEALRVDDGQTIERPSGSRV